MVVIWVVEPAFHWVWFQDQVHLFHTHVRRWLQWWWPVIQRFDFVPNKGTDIKFADITTSGANPVVLFTAAQQQEASEKFISNNDYLNSRRGQYAERNGLFFPWLTRFDLTVAQDFTSKWEVKRMRFRSERISSMWATCWTTSGGVGNLSTTVNPLSFASVGADGVPAVRMATQVKDGKTILLEDSFVKAVNFWQRMAKCNWVWGIPSTNRLTSEKRKPVGSTDGLSFLFNTVL